jgi:hypothetical protein
MVAPIEIVAGPVAALMADLIDRIFPDKDKQAQQRSELLLKAQSIDAQLAQGQLAVNRQEATNGNLFVAGWRPFIGWVCGSAFAYHFLLQPVIILIASLTGAHPQLPVFDISALSTVLMGMLGLGTLRTAEKMGDKGHLPWQQ